MKQQTTIASLICVIGVLLLSGSLHAQVVFDFEDGNLDLWGVEGDGYIVLEETNGNPGKALRVEEPATGANNYVIGHPNLLGDWSSVTSADSLFFDLYAHQIDGTVFSEAYLVQLRGAGNILAEAMPDFVPEFDVWQRIAIPLDPDHWDMTSGTWEQLISSVEMLRIRSEFITGDETNMLDNIGLTFSPIVKNHVGTICSIFEPEDGFDGWNIQNAFSIASSSDEGNLPNSIQIEDKADLLTLVYAPSKFLGNWTSLSNTSTLSFDVKVNTSLNSVDPPENLVRLYGPGGEATVSITEAVVLEFQNTWKTLVFPLNTEVWNLVSGTWDGLMNNVTLIELALEFYQGTAETVFFDNFCIGEFEEPSVGIDFITATDKVTIYPNPSSGIFNIQLATEDAPHYYTIADASGRIILSERLNDQQTIDLSDFASGFYFIRLELTGGRQLIRQVTKW